MNAVYISTLSILVLWPKSVFDVISLGSSGLNLDQFFFLEPLIRPRNQSTYTRGNVALTTREQVT